ncbi:unnamed protein product [Rotaria sp. Silwood2]|nr:unnamed protein product [Rotaria sp. Silwood2]
MASPSSSKTPCTSHGCKSVGILKCEGCSQIFCRPHVLEHRDLLSHQLDGIVLEHDTLQQMIVEQKNKENNHHSLLEQIDKWEQNSIKKIQQTANEARQQIEILIGSQKKMHDLTEQLRKARVDDDFIETDLRMWTDMLEKLKHDFTNVSSSTIISEDPTKLLVSKIFVSSIVPQHLEKDERFGESFGTVCIAENGHLAYHGLDADDAFVHGVQKYSSGKYKIRFVMNKKNSRYFMAFNIVSKSASVLKKEFQVKESIYGWYTNDIARCGGDKLPFNNDLHDMQGETTFEIEFLLDCDNQKIGYFNERTKYRREMNVDVTKCPLPWQLLFYLYDVEDSVRLLSSEQLL